MTIFFVIPKANSEIWTSSIKVREELVVDIYSECLNTERPESKEIRMEGDLEFRQFGFQTYRLLELHPNCLKSELATPIIIQHLNAISMPFRLGVGLLKKH